MLNLASDGTAVPGAEVKLDNARELALLVREDCCICVAALQACSNSSIVRDMYVRECSDNSEFF